MGQLFLGGGHFWLADLLTSNFIPPSIMHQEAWKKVQLDILREIPAENASKWLRSTRLEPSIDPSTFVLNVPDKKILSHLRSYTKPIQSRMQSILGHPVAVEFRLAEEASDWVNPDHSFDSFIESHCNRTAFRGMKAAAEHTGRHNPVFLFGPPGSGKTHLLHAYAAAFTETAPRKTAHLTGADFKLGYLRSLAARSTLDFKQNLRSLDCLIIDDAHMIGSGKSTLEELDYIVTAFVDQGRQAIIASESPPEDVFGSGRLRSRILSGLVLSLEAPDPPLLEKLALRFVESLRLELNAEALHRVTRLAKGVRDLESMLGRISLQMQSEEIAPENIHSLLTQKVTRPTLDSIVTIVSEYFGVSKKDLLSSSRKTEHAFPRHIAMYLAIEHGGMSKSSVARFFKKKDHTSVVHATRKMKLALTGDTRAAQAVAALVTKL